MRRFLPVALLVIAALVPAEVHAEGIDTGRGTVNVAPIVTGPTVSSGLAGFGPGGTQALANSTNQPATPPSPPVGTPGSGSQAGPAAVVVTNPQAFIAACQAGQAATLLNPPPGLPSQCASGVLALGPLPQPGAATPLALAQQASAQQPWPALQVGINPGTGLTGLASWYWLAGNPQMPDATATAGPLTVTVHATLIEVVWDFGDGGGLSSGADLGRAFPAQSSIQHIFETDTFGRPAGFKCTALVRYQVTYSVNGGPFADLGVKANPYSVSYQVNQLQPEAVTVP
jgi:hypothetical protein